MFKIPDYRVFATPRFRRFKIPDHREFATSGLRGFEIPENRKCFAPEKHISRTLLNFDVSRVTGFPEFRNTSPSGKVLYTEYELKDIAYQFN
jgi:hypothetical protein